MIAIVGEFAKIAGRMGCNPHVPKPATLERRNGMSEQNSNLPADGSQTAVCRSCGMEFQFDHVLTKAGGIVEQCIPRRCLECRDSRRNTTKARPKNTSWVCAYCSQPFTGRRRKYCSPACSNGEHRDRERQKTCVCKQCGKEFLGPKGKVWCSRKCQNAGFRAKAIERAKASNQTILSISDIPTLNANGLTGALGELLFDLWCLKSGIQCARPIRENNPVWDRIIYYCGEWKTVQIKTSGKELKVARAIERTLYPVDLIAVVDAAKETIALLDARSHSQQLLIV